MIKSEYDLLVIGAGPAGMAAALVAAISGLDVLICEKSDRIGGTAATAAGTIWIPGNRQSREAGFKDSREQAQAYLQQVVTNASHGEELRRKYLEIGSDVVDWFQEHTELRFVPCGTHPDYLPEKGAAISGRALIPAPFDGRLLKHEFRNVRAPIPEFLVFGGMMVGKDDVRKLLNIHRSAGNFFHALKLILRYASDRIRYPRGTRLVMGNALVARLYYSLLQRDVRPQMNARLVDLRVAEGRVTGAMLEVDGRSRFVGARRGVVLATGGLSHNQALRQTYMPQAPLTKSMAVSTNTGDGIEAASRIGGKACAEAYGTAATWAPVSLTGSTQWGGLFPHLVLDRAKPGLIAVNAAGARFTNEANSYHHFVEGMFRSHETTPTIPAWLVCDAAFVRRYGLGAIRPGARDVAKHERSGYLATAPTLRELAAKIHVDARGLELSVQLNNEFARIGVDEDFGKGSTELNRFNGDPEHLPNPCIGEIRRAPFCAVAVWPADLACGAGLETDEFSRVLNDDGKPIDGLYACGNDLASIMRGAAPGPGTTLGPALVFAWIAARHAAASGSAA